MRRSADRILTTHTGSLPRRAASRSSSPTATTATTSATAITWAKLAAIADGAALASKELYRSLRRYTF
jgi:hypothetical protein